MSENKWHLRGVRWILSSRVASSLRRADSSMKRYLTAFCLSVILLSCCVATVAGAGPDAPVAQSGRRAEAFRAIEKGLAWLKQHQNSDGSWSLPEHPALTALPLTAFLQEKKGAPGAAQPPFIEKGFDFIRSKAKPDGSIYEKGLSNYNTSVCLLALLAKNDPKDEALMRRAHDFIASLQARNMTDESLDGGMGYGPTAVSAKRQHPDLDNTLMALEAIRAYRQAHPQLERPAADLNWKAAIEFISRCQNLPEKNPAASAAPANRGGFVYYPGYSNAAPDDGSDPLRSYGSMTYAGLLSFIYADVKKDDVRVKSAVEWLKKNFSVDENPNMGPAGFYYYLNLMSKGLTAAEIKELDTADGRKISWAAGAVRKLAALQKPDGSWSNDESGRFMEKDPVLVTSYCILSLELAQAAL